MNWGQAQLFIGSFFSVYPFASSFFLSEGPNLFEYLVVAGWLGGRINLSVKSHLAPFVDSSKSAIRVRLRLSRAHVMAGLRFKRSLFFLSINFFFCRRLIGFLSSLLPPYLCFCATQQVIGIMANWTRSHRHTHSTLVWAKVKNGSGLYSFFSSRLFLCPKTRMSHRTPVFFFFYCVRFSFTNSVQAKWFSTKQNKKTRKRMCEYKATRRMRLTKATPRPTSFVNAYQPQPMSLNIQTTIIKKKRQHNGGGVLCCCCFLFATIDFSNWNS